MQTKQEALLGSEAQEGKEGKGTQENCSATWLKVSDLMVIGISL